jgi:NADH-quinone oxidoreductase subunit C
METPVWYQEAKKQFADAILSERESVAGEIEVVVKPSKLLEILAFFKSPAGGAFEHLADLSGYDEGAHTPRFYVFYELISMMGKKRLRVVTPLESNESPRCPSATPLWKGANWLEREVFDMYGIDFDNHPDQRRILLPASFQGYPLRKDFDLFYRQQFVQESDGEEVFDPFGNTEVKSVEER